MNKMIYGTFVLLKIFKCFNSFKLIMVKCIKNNVALKELTSNFVYALFKHFKTLLPGLG